MITLIRDAEIYAPEPMGKGSIVLVGSRIAALGALSASEWKTPGVELRVISGSGLIAVPGLIDPHEHLIGGSGESGFGSQTPEIFFHEIVSAGITTVVGCLGVDTSARTMPALLGKAKGLRQQGLTAYLWSGGYPVPPLTLTGSIENDVLYIEEIIGAGEIAISDLRSSQPAARELARVVAHVRNAGLLAGKAGVTHFHVGEAPDGLALLRALLDDFAIEPACLYPTHVQRSEGLMHEAVALTQRGCAIDIDTFDEDVPRWLRFFLQQGTDPTRLTFSTDAAINSPDTLLGQIRACVHASHRLEDVLPCATSNTADVLKIRSKGRLKPGMDADMLLIRRDDLSLSHVFASGELLFAEGKMVSNEPFLELSNRKVSLYGSKQI